MITNEQLHLYNNIFLKDDYKPLFPNINTKIKRFILTKLLKDDFIIDFNQLEWKDKKGNIIIFIDSGFYKLNTAKINEDGTIKKDFLEDFFKKFNEIKEELSKKLEIDDNNDESSLELINKDVYRIERHHTIADVYNSMFITEGFCKFKFDFNNNGLRKCSPTNINNLQRFEVKINSKIMIYDHLAKLHFRCSSCGHEFFKSYKELESTNLKTECPNIILGAEGKPKVCKKALSKHTMNSKTVNINVYDAVYINNKGEPESILVESMEELQPYIYDAVGFRLQSDGEAYLFVLDYIEVKNNIIDVNNFKKDIIKIKEEKKDLNLIPYWFKYIDNNIKKFSGCDVLGMEDIKFVLLLQKINHIFKKKYNGFDLNNNLAVVGDNSGGKTWTLEHYSYFLYGGRFKAVDGENISTPALRGSSKTNRDITKGNKNTPGLLSLYNNILIDEINLNTTDIMTELKPTLNAEIFGNNKADGDKIERPRTCHINITENINKQHLSIIHGMTKKEYENLYNDTTIEKSGDEPEKFDYKWNIFQHIDTYNNFVLREAIKNVRQKMLDDGIHFIDGREFAVHDRFPFWYVIKRDKNNEKVMDDRAIAAMKRKGKFGKKEQYLAINKKLQQLTIDNIDDLFLWLEDYINTDVPDEVYFKILNIQKEYNQMNGIEARLAETLMMILQVSRILNLRKDFTDVDFNMVKRYLYMRDRTCLIQEFNDMNKFNNIITINNNDDESDDFKGFV